MKKERITTDQLQELIKQQIEESKTRLVYEIKIRDKIIINPYLIFSSFPKRVSFEDCIFSEVVSFSVCKIDKNISFAHCFFLKSVNFTNCSISEEIFFIKSKIYEGITFHQAFLEKITIDITSSCKKIITSFDSKFKYFSLVGQENAIFNEVWLSPSTIEEKMYLYNCNCKELTVTSYPKGLTKELELFNCKINNLFFDNFRNDGILKFTDCSPLIIPNEKSFLTINQSNLGKAEFLQFDFANYDEVNIINSYIGSCIFVNTKWDTKNINAFWGRKMKNYLLDRKQKSGIGWNIWKFILKSFRKQFSNYKETIKQLECKRDAYKQIKYALSTQGDSINEKLFYATEMDTYNKTLNLSLRNISTKTILCLSKITSNYGQSLFRPIVTIIVINGILFCWLVFNQKIPEIEIVSFNGLIHGEFIDIKALAQFLYFCNPLHKQPDFTGINLIIDIIGRVISSYVIYNIIRATRRFIN